MRKLAQQPLQIDGDVDSDVVFHEYGHGLTWRMIGGSSPSFENMRDGILRAVAVGGNATDCANVWAAFAQFGVGAGSSAVINADGTVTTTPSFTAGSCN